MPGKVRARVTEPSCHANNCAEAYFSLCSHPYIKEACFNLVDQVVQPGAADAFMFFPYVPAAWLPDNAATLLHPHAIAAFQLFGCLFASRDLSADRHLGKPALTVLVLVALAFRTRQTVYGQRAFVVCHVVKTTNACVSCSA